MLRLPAFDVVAPDTIESVVAALAQPGARIIAGGTDILPNLKHRFSTPSLLVSLSKCRALRHITIDDGVMRIGAAVTLTDISLDEHIREHFPSLAKAAGLIASPLIRNAGTIGGNINLDTRCKYVNQSDFWRSAIGGCLKSNGTVCHVVPGGKSCVAAMSSDLVPVLHTLDASVCLVSSVGERSLFIADYYNTDGIMHLNRDPGELTTEISIPLPSGPRRCAYAKWTVRKSIDFPLVSIALRFDLDRDTANAEITNAKICVGVLAAKPKLIKQLDSVIGMRLSDKSVAEIIAELVHKQGKPLPNVPYDTPYRRKMLPVYTRRAIADLV